MIISMILIFIFIYYMHKLIYKIIINGDYSKGNIGERIVANILEQIPGNKRIINDIMLNDNGKSRQIDHIFISNKGVFVIETKNYSGSIYGKETSNEWIEYLNKKKYNFTNPIFQNYAHKQIISKIINDYNNVISIIVFTKSSKLKVKSPRNIVINTGQLKSCILNQKDRLNDKKIDEYYNIIMNNRITDEEVIRNHNYNVEHYIEYKNSLINKNICPRCKTGRLIVREDKYGKFIGCSNYPKCKYTKNI